MVYLCRCRTGMVNNTKPVAICKDLLSRERQDFGTIQGWEDWLNEHQIPWVYIDCYRSDIIHELPKYSALLWHYANFVNADLMEAQNILNLAEEMGLIVYPDYHTGWHFDDKIAEMYALQAAGAPIPKSWVFYEMDKCINWLEKDAVYPIIAKLRRGSGSNNVKLIKNASEGKRYAKRMFSKGMSPTQSLVYKTYSKIQSTRDWKTFVYRFHQIPNFLKARKYGKGMPMERGYCYFQQFILNANFDIKVAVVNGKCSFFTRHTRKGDFRASGSGDFFYDKTLLTDNIVQSAFETAEKLHTQCIGFDFVVDKDTKKGYIIEMCHGFDADAVYDCGGYWDQDLVWHDEPLNVKFEIMDKMFGKE